MAKAGAFSLAVGLASAVIAGSVAWLLGLGSFLADAAMISGVLLSQAARWRARWLRPRSRRRPLLRRPHRTESAKLGA